VQSAAIVIAGPSGVGKTTVGRALASALGWEFVDADSLHSADNIERMRRGISLTDEDRQPWLESIRQTIRDRIAARRPVVVACSALREEYREFLIDGRPDVVIVMLDASREVLQARLANRDGHFAGTSLLNGQLATLERPRHGVIVDASQTPEQIVAEIRTLVS
jgi:gluconokinase